MSRQLYDFKTIIPKFDAILARGLCRGVGNRNGQMCVEAAICAVLDLPHGDDPECVEPAIRSYKIRLNDSGWSSAHARAEGLRDLGIAQIGSRGVVDGRVFAKRMADKTIRVLLPILVRETERFSTNRLMDLADRCEREGSRETALGLKSEFDALYAADATDAAADDAAAASAMAAAYAAEAAYAADAVAYAAARAASAADAVYAADTDPKARDRFLRLSASLALEILIDMKSPGAEWVQS
jgi:hypothetical protein